MADDRQTTDPREAIHPLGRDSMTTAYAQPGGMLVLDIWPHDDAQGRRYLMTPGQALALIGKLADAAQRALRETVG